MAELLELGKIIVTATVSKKMRGDISFSRFVAQSLGRYLHGDLGNMDSENIAMENEGRISATYQKHFGDTIMKILIITEADRSSTTIMFPEEY